MRQDLYNGAVSRLSVRSIDRCSHARRVCCCGPGGQKISIDSIGRRTGHSSTAVSSKGEQCHVSSRRRRLDTDLLLEQHCSRPQQLGLFGSLLHARGAATEKALSPIRRRVRGTTTSYAQARAVQIERVHRQLG